MISTRISHIQETINKDGYVTPKCFKDTCFEWFDKAISNMRKGRRVKKKVKSDGSPAYTIYYDPGAGITQLDIDLVPSFKVEGWSDVARRINPRWILADDKVNDSMKCYDVVCKACPVLSHRHQELLWRLSFAKTEKMLITYANSTDGYKFKKNSYKCLKLCIDNVKTTNPEETFKWSSYILKHFIFHQYDNWPECSDKLMIQRTVVKQLISDLSKARPIIKNYFIEKDNIISHIQNE